jgi:hypothetical protein
MGAQGSKLALLWEHWKPACVKLTHIPHPVSSSCTLHTVCQAHTHSTQCVKLMHFHTKCQGHAQFTPCVKLMHIPHHVARIGRQGGTEPPHMVKIRRQGGRIEQSYCALWKPPNVVKIGRQGGDGTLVLW